VLSKGTVVAQTTPAQRHVLLNGGDRTIDFRRP
jgi:hypothetical protein